MRDTHHRQNPIEDNIDAVNKNTETLIGACKEVGLKINAEKTKHIVVCRPVARQRPRNKQQSSLGNGSANRHERSNSTATRGYNNNGKWYFLCGPCRDVISRKS
jgi:hypothetical protein